MKHVIRISSLTLSALMVMAILPVQVEGKSKQSAQMVVALRGTSIGELRTMDLGGDGDDALALCFDLDIIDLKTGRKMGTASDCLSNIVVVAEGGIALVGRTIFNFRGGTLVTRGLTSVQPTTHGSLDFTHITGAIPQSGDNSVLAGTGRFKDASGPVRLSGAVKMMPVDPDKLQITFDCIFDIRLSRNH